MQAWEYAFKYCAIYMVWCVGYLNKPTLIEVLRDAKLHLKTSEQKTRRNRPPTSFIFVLDTVLDKNERNYTWEGQRVRHQAELERIFEDAGLQIYKRSERMEMPQDYSDVMVWALC